MSQSSRLCFSGAMNALAQGFVIGVEHDVGDREAGVAQPGKYLIQVATVQDGLRGDEVLAGESGWFGGGGHDHATPRRPVLEVGHRVVGEVGLQHVARRSGVEHAAGWDQAGQFRGSGGLAAAEGSVQPGDHASTLRGTRTARPRCLALAGTSAGIAAAKCRHMTIVYGAALLVTWKSAWRQAQVNPRDGICTRCTRPGLI